MGAGTVPGSETQLKGIQFEVQVKLSSCERPANPALQRADLPAEGGGGRMASRARRRGSGGAVHVGPRGRCAPQTQTRESLRFPRYCHDADQAAGRRGRTERRVCVGAEEQGGAEEGGGRREEGEGRREKGRRWS